VTFKLRELRNDCSIISGNILLLDRLVYNSVDNLNVRKKCLKAFLYFFLFVVEAFPDG
jgi:hypothetical protein